MKTLLITQARISSSRLPGKILERLGDGTVLDLHLRRAKQAKLVTDLCVATTEEPGAEQIVAIAKRNGFSSYQGSTDDVLDRFYQAALPFKPDNVVRVTSDCPLLDPQLIDELIEKFCAEKVDYASNCLPPTLPDGQSVEVMTFAALARAWKEAKLKSEREHVTPYIWSNSNLKSKTIFRAYNLAYVPDRSEMRMTLDYPEDLQVLKKLVELAGADATCREYVNLLETNQDLRRINSGFKRGAGYLKSLEND